MKISSRSLPRENRPSLTSVFGGNSTISDIAKVRIEITRTYLTSSLLNIKDTSLKILLTGGLYLIPIAFKTITRIATIILGVANIAFDLAIKNKDFAQVKRLMDAGAKPNRTNRENIEKEYKKHQSLENRDLLISIWSNLPIEN